MCNRDGPRCTSMCRGDGPRFGWHALVRATAPIPAMRADVSSTGPRHSPDSGHACGLVAHWSASSPWFRTRTRTGRPLVRTLAPIPAKHADYSRTARQAFQAPPQRLGRGRTSGAGRVAQSEFRGMRGAQARREGGAVRAPEGREFAALPRQSDERPSRE